MTQVISGVNISVALTATFQSAFANSVAFILNIDTTAVNIGSVVAAGRRLLAGTGGGVSVLYSVTANNVVAAALQVSQNNGSSSGGQLPTVP